LGSYLYAIPCRIHHVDFNPFTFFTINVSSSSGKFGITKEAFSRRVKKKKLNKEISNY
jgi:hypothetical protein